MILLIVWLLIGAYGLVENADLITSVEDKKNRLFGMGLIVIGTPFRIITGIFEYMLEQIFGEEWEDGDDSGKPC